MGMYFENGKTLKDKKKEADKLVGSKLKTIRKSLNMTQKVFAEEYNIKGGYSAVSKMENAKRSMSADLLPILAEDGNITVEQFYRDNAIILNNVMYDCLSRMDIDGKDIEPIMRYVEMVTDEAMDNLGANKLFDLLFTVIRYASLKGNARRIMVDELNVIDLDDYGNNKSSRYINYLKEMSIDMNNK